MFSVLLIALGLSMDAFAVALGNGMCFRRVGKKEILSTGFFFGLSQGLMPVIGYYAGQTFRRYVDTWANWLSLLLLGGIGGHMVWEAWKELHDPESCGSKMELSVRLLFLQSLATSIDALVVGVGFAVMDVSLAAAASSIAVVTFFCSCMGVIMGKQCAGFLKNRAQIFGGALLILLGLKIFTGG